MSGALCAECESDCARRVERVGESESGGAAVVSGAGIGRASGAFVFDEHARVRTADCRTTADAESGGDESFREGEPGQREITDLAVECGFSGRQASRGVAGGFRSEAGGLQWQRELRWRVADEVGGCDEGC